MFRILSLRASKKLIKYKRSMVVNEGPTYCLPNEGTSSGDKELDEATRKWRRTNTVDDQRLTELYQHKFSKEGGGIKNLLEESQNLKSNSKNVNEKTLSFSQKISPNDINGMKPSSSPKETSLRIESQQKPPAVNLVTGEIGGPEGKEPTRYGDWERKGRCFDF